MPVCPNCLSREMVRFGLYDNQQKWHCNKCKKTTIYPRLRMPKKPRLTKGRETRFVD